jgi:menaquinone-dependent protoporphyrinogen oxidase
MINKKILIAYGTRYGSTEEISQEIAKTLREKGLEPELLNLGKIKSKKWPQLDDFDGVIIGTSLKINKWKKEVKSFLDKNKIELKKENKKLGVFTCSLYAVGEPTKAREEISSRLIENHELEADIYDAFGGVIDLSEDSKVGKLSRMALRLGAKEMSDEMGVKIDLNGFNDFRDWDKIRSFAGSFADKL